MIVLTPTHRDNECIPSKGANAPLKNYVEIIKEVSQFYSLPVLDLFANSGIQPEIGIMKYKFMPDGLHPNDAGHKLLAEKLTAFLKNM